MSDIPPCLPDRVAGPDVLYSSQPGPVIQIDGACFSRPRLAEAIVAEDDLIIVSTGTNLNDCARVECGPVALYCYESIDLPVTAILAIQPQHFPSPVVALAENRSRCYHNPSFVRTITENYGTVFSGIGEAVYGSYAFPVELATCGVSYQYESCNGNEQIVVVNESSPTVYYGGQCWTNPQVVINYGTDLLVVAGTNVTPVSGCADIMCSGSDANGATVTYTDQQLGHTVNVEFNNIGIGVPYYGVIPEKIDDGESGLKPGQVTIAFDAKHRTQTIIQSVSAPGRLAIQVSLKGHQKKLVITRWGTDTVYPLGQGENSLFLDVMAGDKVWMELASNRASTAKVSGRVTGFVRWKSAPLSLRRYDEVQLNYVGATAVRAVGFCGIAARTPYVFFGTLPVEDQSVYPNPDTYLTVQGATGPEQVLVSSFAQGERLPPGPKNTVAYDGGNVVGPLTFRFYTGRGSAGAHGEMDVWLDTPGQFPDALAAGRYSLLVRPDNWYRRTAQVGDTRRSALTVALPGVPYTLPGVYASSEGAVVVAEGPLAPSITSNGTNYSLTGTAYGLAYQVISAAPA
ncbi:MAG: hypothetical protein ACOYB3_00925 [Azonexus sp.]